MSGVSVDGGKKLMSRWLETAILLLALLLSPVQFALESPPASQVRHGTHHSEGSNAPTAPELKCLRCVLLVGSLPSLQTVPLSRSHIDWARSSYESPLPRPYLFGAVWARAPPSE